MQVFVVSPSKPASFYLASLFGSLSISRSVESGKVETISLLMPAKSTSFLAHLLIKKGESINRLVLASQFWPEASERQARHAVSQAIWHIHSQIPGLLQTKLDTVGISPNFPTQVDVTEFENLVQSCLSSEGEQVPVIQNLVRAVELYQGDLIEGCYDDWIVVERERLRELYFQALEHLIPALKTACHYDQALVMALRLANADPLRESAHREAMRLFDHLGRPEAALKQFEAFRQIFQIIGNRRAEILAQLNIITVRHSILGENEAIRPEVEAALADAEAENDLSTKQSRKGGMRLAHRPWAGVC